MTPPALLHPSSHDPESLTATSNEGRVLMYLTRLLAAISRINPDFFFLLLQYILSFLLPALYEFCF